MQKLYPMRGFKYISPLFGKPMANCGLRDCKYLGKAASYQWYIFSASLHFTFSLYSTNIWS